MKKILLYIDTLYRGGAQRVMSNLASYFSLNYDVVLVNDFIQDEKKDSYVIPENVKRVYLRSSLTGNPVVKNISRIVSLRKVIKSENPDVVLSFLGSPNKRMLISTIGLKCKKVVSVRNDPNHEYGTNKINRFIARSLFSLADGVVFQTNDASKYFSKKIRDRSIVIMNPVNDTFFSQPRLDNLYNVVTVGRMEAQKNHHLLLKAWKLIEKQFPDDMLVIYGDGPLRETYEQYIRKNDLEKRVKLPGAVTDVPQKLSEAKVFVLSSDFEGMPNALMEAMAVGVPVISTDCPCGGPKELIVNGVSGILVPTNSVEELGDAMKKLLDNFELRESIGKTAKESSKRFSMGHVMCQWEEYLFSV